MLRRLLISGFGAIVVSLSFAAFSSNSVFAFPTQDYPEFAYTCVHDDDEGCVPTDSRGLFLAVGDGEHTSNVTTTEIYPSSNGNVTIDIINAGYCTTVFTYQSIDFGGAFETDYTIHRKDTGQLVASRNDIGSTCSTQAISFNANASFTYELRASADSADTAENSYRLSVTSGNATLGAGSTASGGISIVNRDILAGNATDFNMFFATDCSYTNSARIQFFDADVFPAKSSNAYQNTTNPYTYPNLGWTLDSRVRGSGTWSVIDAGVAVGGDGPGSEEDISGSLTEGYEYRLRITGLTRPNALEISLPNGVSQRFVGVDCPPSVVYSLTPTVTLPKTVVVPGEVVTNIQYRVCTQSGNSAATGISVDPDGDIWDPSASSQNISGNGGCWNAIRSFTVPAAAAPGDTYCGTVSATPRSSTNSSGITSNEPCFVVSTSYNHSVPANTDVGGGYISGESGSVSICVTNSGNWASPTSTSYSLRNNQTNAVSAIDVGSSGSVPAGGGCRDILVPFTIGAGAAIGDDYCFTLRVTADRGTFTNLTTFTSVGVTSGQICARVVEQPYLEVSDGSVWAGGDFDSSSFGFGQTSCSVRGGANNGFIRSVIRQTIGSYSKYWAGATDDINGFSTVSAATPQNNSLAFANESAGPGNFYRPSEQGRCITDLYTYLVRDVSDPRVQTISGSTPGTLAAGQYISNGNLNINTPLTLGDDQAVTIIVDGNVTISENITYSYSANSAEEIPVFVLVVNGDINITSNVTELNGLYMARGSSGEIDTCSDGPNRLALNDCRDQLTINGIFAAVDIEFRRTFGGVSGLNSNGGLDPAELFGSTDELYIAKPTLITNFDALLRTSVSKDLPPVID